MTNVPQLLDIPGRCERSCQAGGSLRTLGRALPGESHGPAPERAQLEEQEHMLSAAGPLGRILLQHGLISRELVSNSVKRVFVVVLLHFPL